MPTNKDMLTGVAGAVTVIIVGIVQQFTEIVISAVFASAMTTIIAACASYFTRDSTVPK